jgi:hypothetical protein
MPVLPGEKEPTITTVKAETGPFFRLYSSARRGMAFKGYASDVHIRLAA